MAIDQGQNQRGYLMLLVGDERRTSDAALGIALRGAGHGLRVHIIEFLKTGRERGEVAAVSFLTGVTLSQYGMIDIRTRPEELRGPAISPERLQAALREARQHVQFRVTNILILDGLLTLVDEGMVEDRTILEIVEGAAAWTDIVLTGRAATPALQDAADSVTLMQTIKVREHEPLRRGLHY
ncbi:MAG: cob(I)yrinic acid a,c-diamide adenosyltransferase [Thermomicrobium sp.]|nr:cob(I)yrinic acid a,c-diamide adenosyltransferase [Thermomicrobium sp.]